LKKNRYVTISAAALFASVHVTYLFLSLSQPVYPIVVVAGILFFVTIEYISHFRQISVPPQLASAGITVISSVGGALFTYLLSHAMHLGPVGAGAAVGTFAGLLPAEKYNFLENVRLSTYCGAFVGMSSVHVLGSALGAVWGGMLCGLIIIMATGALPGYGGKLGTIAFISVCILSIISNISPIC